MDAVMLARIQFAVVIIYHFLFVPLSIGIGCVLVFAERRYYKSGKDEDKAAANFWIKIFTATFAVGVATGITMEFAFGTNWASFSRFVGDIFGAPLAAEALFAFFLESMFLAVLLFGRNRVSKKFFYVSTWLVWLGSLLSAFWIIIAGSWMQSPAGYKIVEAASGPKAIMTSFWQAAFNPTTLPRYFHTIVAIMIMGGFIAMFVGAYNMLKGKNSAFAKKTMGFGAGLALIFSCLMLPAGHWQAASMAATQPAKLAAMEGHWEDGPMSMGLVGWVDVKNEKTHQIAIPKAISLLANFDPNYSYPGIKTIRQLAAQNKLVDGSVYKYNKNPEKGIPNGNLPNIEMTYQSYRIMLFTFPLLILISLLAWWWNRKDLLAQKKGYLKFLMWATLIPLIGIEFGWATAEMGRQPWTVYNMLLTNDAVSATVPAGQILFTILCFIAIYTLIYIAWVRIVWGFIKKGPQLESGEVA